MSKKNKLEGIEVGDRVQYKKKVGEVKWKGTLPEMEALGLYIGVEVVVGRGKNNGDFNGVEVFKVDTPGQGEFLSSKTRLKKLSSAADSGWDFENATVVDRSDLRRHLGSIPGISVEVIEIITDMAFLFQFDVKTSGGKYEDAKVALSDNACLASFEHATNRFTKIYAPQMILTSISLEHLDKVTLEIIDTSVNFYTSVVIASIQSEPAFKLGNVKKNGCCLYNSIGILKFPDVKIKCEEFTSGDMLSITYSETNGEGSTNCKVAFYLNDAFQGMGTITCKPPFRVGVMSGGFCKIKLVKMEKLDEPAEVYV